LEKEGDADGAVGVWDGVHRRGEKRRGGEEKEWVEKRRRAGERERVSDCGERRAGEESMRENERGEIMIKKKRIGERMRKEEEGNGGLNYIGWLLFIPAERANFAASAASNSREEIW
jgi:hypothetical protein